MTGVPQGLIACAHEGSLLDDRDPHPESGDSLYLAMLRRVRTNGGRVAGVLWYQGCSEANEGKTGDYAKKTIRLIETMRADMGDPELPVVIAQIARFHWNRLIRQPEVCPYLDQSWSSIREQQRLLAEPIHHTRLGATIDLPQEDYIHLSAEGQHQLGRRFADAASSLPPPRVAPGSATSNAQQRPNKDVGALLRSWRQGSVEDPIALTQG